MWTTLNLLNTQDILLQIHNLLNTHDILLHIYNSIKYLRRDRIFLYAITFSLRSFFHKVYVTNIKLVILYLLLSSPILSWLKNNKYAFPYYQFSRNCFLHLKIITSLHKRWWILKIFYALHVFLVSISPFIAFFLFLLNPRFTEVDYFIFFFFATTLYNIKYLLLE